MEMEMKFFMEMFFICFLEFVCNFSFGRMDRCNVDDGEYGSSSIKFC